MCSEQRRKRVPAEMRMPFRLRHGADIRYLADPVFA
jgi:hypothetical protein